MIEQPNDIKQQFIEDLAKASAVLTESNLRELRVSYLGRKNGKVTLLFDQLLQISVEEKRVYGPALHELKQYIESTLLVAEQKLSASLEHADIDLTLKNPAKTYGHLHPITLVQKEIEQIFLELGFSIELGPEIDTDFYNFEALNIPELHPARDMQDTFYIDENVPAGDRGKNLLLRTHISNMQVRYMEMHKPPYSVILPGRVFRNEALDASHEHTYQYIEGMVVGSNANFSTMSWTLDTVFKKLFGNDVRIKLRPSYFPFVEPGAEMAISCLVCNGKGCSVCKQTGWVEILGCGMIHKKVFAAAGFKKPDMQGFAFGFGLSRIALMKYSIPDIRLFAENDLRFLKQF